MKNRLPDLTSFSLLPVSMYAAAKDTVINGWKVEVDLFKRQTTKDIEALHSWLKQRLPGDTVVLWLNR
jgi:hypothetical protein